MLSDDTTTQFRAALREHCSDAPGAQATLTDAVNTAAIEARDNGIAVEHFVIWVKRAWDEMMDEGRLTYSPDPTHMRDVVISSAIKAYYVQ